jgi:hypothetical protein
MKKKLFFVVLILIVVSFGVYKYLYQEHRDISSEKATHTSTVKEIFKSFVENDSLANVTYLDKTIELHGKISNIDFSNKIITVDEKLLARFNEILPGNIKLLDSIKLKGRLMGFDDLLEEIQMDQCTIIK